MTKIGVISNARSQRNLRSSVNFRSVLPANTNSLHANIKEISDVGGVLADFARQEVGLIVIDGGDGTVQATLTELFNGSSFECPPLISILPRGMTNMIANDVGLAGRSDKALFRLAAAVSEGDVKRFVVERNVMRVRFDPNLPPTYGMFLGTAGIYRAIQVCRGWVHPLRIESSLAVSVTFAGLIAQWILYRGTRGNIYRGDRIASNFDNQETIDGCQLIVLVTTLARLVLNSRPFWGRGEGALRYTSVAFPPARLMRSLIPLLYGGADRNLPSRDYVSRNAGSISLRMNCSFTIDGEFFTPVPGEPVALSCDQQVGFVRC